MQNATYIETKYVNSTKDYLMAKFTTGYYLDFKIWDLNSLLNSMDSYQMYLLENIPQFLILLDPRLIITLSLIFMLFVYIFGLFPSFPRTRRAVRLGLSYFVFIKIALESILVLSLLIYPKIFFLSSLMSFGNHLFLICTIPVDIAVLRIIATMRYKDVTTRKSVFTNKKQMYSHLIISPANIACSAVDKILYLAQKSTSYVNYCSLLYSLASIFIKPIAYYTGVSSIINPLTDLFTLGISSIFGTGRDPRFLFFAHKLFPYHPVNLSIFVLLEILKILGIGPGFFLFTPLITIASELINLGFMKMLRLTLRQLALYHDRIVMY